MVKKFNHSVHGALFETNFTEYPLAPIKCFQYFLPNLTDQIINIR